ncbi:hypothetical protein ACU8KH_00151 [Lachancea thermotolerans]
MSLSKITQKLAKKTGGWFDSFRLQAMALMQNDSCHQHTLSGDRVPQRMT